MSQADSKPIKAVPAWQGRLDAYEKLLRLDRPIGIALLLWPTLWGLWIAAQGVPALVTLWIFVLGTVLTRSAGCAVNDWADRKIDGKVTRTQNRPLVIGTIKPWEALALAAGLAMVAFAIVLIGLKPLVAKFAVAAAVVAVIYPFTKRFLPMPQAWLGIAFSFGIPMAYAQVYGALPFPNSCWILMAATWFWVVAYDTEYAMVDRADDQKIGVKSSAILFGTMDVPIIAVCYAACFGLLIYVGILNKHSTIYYGGLAVAASFAIYQLRLIRHRDPQQCLKAFLNNNWLGLVITLAIAFDYLPRSAK